MEMSAPLLPYLPRLIRYWDHDTPGELHRSIEGSMLFVDISGFTRMSERLARHGKVGSEEVTQVIDTAFGQLLPEAYAHGANLLKFGGDAMLLLFTEDDHARRAATAALAMRRKLREIGSFATSAGAVVLRVTMGIHSGMFDFFLVGGSHRELIVAGPAATRTVEMESAAQTGQILLSPEAAAFLPTRSVAATLGEGFLLRDNLPENERLEFRPATAPPIDLAGFVPVALRGFLLDGDHGPEHRPATIAFLGFSGIDRMIREEGAAAAASTLDQLMRAVQDAVDSHGVTLLGTDIAPDGGKVILTAGVPRSTGNDEEQMLLAVYQITAARPQLTTRIGIGWGSIFAGEVGPPYRRTYTVMGDAVNLAARLMGRAAPGPALATPAVLEASRTVFRTTPVEPFLVKGKRKPVQAFEVWEPAGTRSAAALEMSPLLGRDEELARQLKSWEAARSGAIVSVEVVAEPGMGKSRLIEEFLKRAGAPRVIRSECRLYQSATPYFPMRALLRAAWDLEEVNNDEAEVRIRNLVRTHAPELAPWLALIGGPVGLEVRPSPEVAALADEFRRPRTQWAVHALLAATLTTPTIFIVEDTHWMDEASQELLAGLTGELRPRPWLFVFTRRPGHLGLILPEEAASRIELQPLTIAQTKEFIVRATESAPLAPRQVEALALRAQGHPLFLVELLLALREGREVDQLPNSVEGLIRARIDSLPSSDRGLLRRLAVLGNGFAAEHTGAVMADSTSPAGNSALQRLQEFLAFEASGWIEFRHALIRDVAYEALPFRTRLQLHAQVGDSIHAANRGQPEAQAELLSLHYSRAKRWADAWFFSRVAGQRAQEMYANSEAATFYVRALEAAHRIGASPAEQADIHKRLAQVRYEAGAFDEARTALRTAIRLVPGDPLVQADLHLQLARVFQKLGAFSPALRETAIGLGLSKAIQDAEAVKLRARLRAFRAGILSDQFRPREALRVGLLAMEEAQNSGELQALARTYSYIDEAYQTLGQREMAIHEPLALEIFERLEDLPGIALLTNNLGVQAYSDGRWEEAISLYRRGQDASRRSGNEAMEGVAGTNLGEVLISRGRLDEAQQVLVEARQVLRAHRYVRFALFADTQLGRLAMERGNYDQAVEGLGDVVSRAAAQGQTLIAVDAAVHLAEAHLRRGEPQEALRVVSDAQRLAGDDAALFDIPLGRVRARAMLESGRPDDAAEHAIRALEGARQQGLVFEQALLLLIKGQLPMIENDARNAALEEAERLLEGLGVADYYFARNPSTSV